MSVKGKSKAKVFGSGDINFPYGYSDTELYLFPYNKPAFNANYTAALDYSSKRLSIPLKNASARRGNGSNLDYTITGLLTTDTIEVVTGSDTPTIPVNGTLRIGATQVVYGVTIKRAGIVWAEIPFCEPYYWAENLPFKSYDISGNSRHATCNTLVAGNITTQNNYFYLIRYGYSTKAQDLLLWDLHTNKWSGVVPNRTFTNLDFVSQDANNYIDVGADGNSLHYKITTAGFTLTLRRGCKTVGQRYVTRLNIKNFYADNGGTNGIALTLDGMGGANPFFPQSNGYFEAEYVQATNSNLQIGRADVTTKVEFDLYDISVHRKEIVPALKATPSIDAVGNATMYVQDGHTWLGHACSIQLPINSDLFNSTSNNNWSDLMYTGLCVATKTYLIEKTETDHFGSGKTVGNTFVSNGTEVLNKNNQVRESISTTNIWYTDSSTPNIVASSAITTEIFPQKQYCKIVYERYNYLFSQTLYNQELGAQLKQKRYYELRREKITDLVFIKNTKNLNETKRYNYYSHYNPRPRLNVGQVIFVFDGVKYTDSTFEGWQRIEPLLTSRNMLMSPYIYQNMMSKAQYLAAQALGHEIQVHSAVKWNDVNQFLDTWKGFSDTAAFYSESELRAYYQEILDYERANGFGTVRHKLSGGGVTDDLYSRVILDYFHAGYLAAGAVGNNIVPFQTYEGVGRYSMDSFNYNTFKTYIDTCAANKTYLVMYAHPSTAWSKTTKLNANGGVDALGKIALDWFADLLDYIASKTASGLLIRTGTSEMSMNIAECKL